MKGIHRSTLAAAALLLVSTCGGCGKDEECSDNSDCDNGLFCDGPEICMRGRCSATLNFPCNDGNDCTYDICDEETDSCSYEAQDYDGDGHSREGCLGGDDCNDYDSDVHPGAEERCNGRDDDCNGTVDEDKDRDGYYDAALCDGGDDCDDENRDVHPGAPEPCDGIDNNCTDGTDDEEDTDGDGHVEEGCGGDDCDDEDDSIHPDVVEKCNGIDDNCNELCDEDFECCQGDERDCITPCDTVGTISCSMECVLSDCIPPDEICDGDDNDCDGLIDEDLPCSPGETVSCETECGTAGTGTCTELCEIPPPEDCHCPEECNGIDDDCDGSVDEGFPCVEGETVPCTTTCGSQGMGECTTGCDIPPAEDCIPPEEICNNLADDDCDGYVDEYDCIPYY